MDRRSFLLQPGAVALLGALGSNALAGSRPPLQRDAAVERRIPEIGQAYDTQGNHRTTTPGGIAAGPPMRQVWAVESERLKKHAASLGEIPLHARASRTATRASNVVVRFAGRDASLPPLVVSTPRSGWWQCAGERGGGIACWLETVRAIAAISPERDVLFAAFSGHETGFIGIEDYLARRADLAKRAELWIHYGANVGVADPEKLFNASEPSVARWAGAALEAKGLAIDHLADSGTLPRGEARAIHRNGARYVSMVCGTDLFHNPGDRWPEAVDVGELGAYASAFSRAVADLAMKKA